MNLLHVVNKVYQNRLLQTEQAFIEFEQALENIISIGDVALISDLCNSFDDSTEIHEVMFGLVHGIEHLYEEQLIEGLEIIAYSVQKLSTELENGWKSYIIGY